MATRRRYTGEFKAKVSLEALRGNKTIQGDSSAAQGSSEPSERLEAASGGGFAGGILEGSGAVSGGP